MGADLWAALDRELPSDGGAAAGRPSIRQIMGEWTGRAGALVVAADLAPLPRGGWSLRLRQERFHAEGSAAEGAIDGAPWPLPVGVCAAPCEGEGEVEQLLLTQREQTFELRPAAAAAAAATAAEDAPSGSGGVLLLNPHAAGVFRTQYSAPLVRRRARPASFLAGRRAHTPVALGRRFWLGGADGGARGGARGGGRARVCSPP
eukprot:SAG11_NODE_4596_length_1840_cov_1.198162_3_plen_204_part_00